MRNWLMACLFWTLKSLLSPSPTWAGLAVMEGVPASNNAIYVDTTNTRLGVGVSAATATFHVNAATFTMSGNPSLTNNGDHWMALTNTGQSEYGLFAGALNGSGIWLQAKDDRNNGNSKYLLLNPAGGGVAVSSAPSVGGEAFIVGNDFTIDTMSAQMSATCFAASALRATAPHKHIANAWISFVFNCTDFKLYHSTGSGVGQWANEGGTGP